MPPSESESGSFSESLSPARSSKISTIGEDFYNSINGGAYISGDDESDKGNQSDSSSDTPTPYLSLEASTPPSSNQHVELNGQHDDHLLSERSSGSNSSAGKQDISNGENDVLLMSERTTGSKGLRDSSYREDTLMLSDKSTARKISAKRDISHGEDTLMISDRSDVLSKRDVAKGDISSRSDRSSQSKNVRDNSNNGDVLMRSDRSGGSRNFRDNSTGYDSLLVSETTDESWRRMANFTGDGDESSISSTPSTPFPELEEMVEEDSNNGSSSPPSSGSLSQRMIRVVDKPPLATLLAPSAPDTSDIEGNEDDMDAALEAALASMSASDISDKNKSIQEGSDEDRSMHGQDIEDIGYTMAHSDQIKANGSAAEEGAASPVNRNNEDADYNGVIGTNNSIRNSERAGKIPRRWILDRIDGTVRPREEEEELPWWRQKPPLFLCLPSPLLGVSPWVFEENPFCVAVGKWGFFGDTTIRDDNKRSQTQRRDVEQSNTSASANLSANDNEISTNPDKPKGSFRTIVMAHAILLNACGFFATILSGLALTRSYPSLLKAAPFGKTTVIPTLSLHNAEGDGAIAGGAVTLYLGLLALGIDNPTASVGDMVVVDFRDFCDTPDTDLFLSAENCNRCADVSVWIAVGYFLTTIAFLPTFAVGVSRLYRSYDANCSKVSAGIWSLVSVLGYIIVLACYSSCLGSLHDGEVLYTSEGAAINDANNAFRDDPEEQFLVAEFDWKMGVGQVLLVIGLVLKLLDFVSNCCIATPTITRSRELQWDYEEGSDALLQREIAQNSNPQEGPPSPQAGD